MIIKINLYNRKIEVIKEIEEGYLSEVKSVGGNVYDYEEYLIVDMNMEKVKSLAQELLKMHGQE